MGQSAAQSLYRGVTCKEPPAHPRLLADWLRPAAPAPGYDHLVVIASQVHDGGTVRIEWYLDFLNLDTHDFASETTPFEVAWPWDLSFSPTPADWEVIGIPVLS